MAYLKETLKLRGFALLHIPLLFLVRPKVMVLDDDRCEVKIPLNYLTKNHLSSMYFGALSMGADLAGGMITLRQIEASGKNVVLIFKDFKADFLKRAEADVHFHCKDGKKIKALVEEAIQTQKRVETSFHVIATTPKKTGDEPIAKFQLTLSLKAKG